MTSLSSHGAASRRQVTHHGRLVPSLWRRTLKDGTTVFEASLRIDGKKKRVVLRAETVTDAIRELEGLRVDRDRGVVNENPLVNPTMTALFDEFLDDLQARVGIRDKKRSVAQNTVDGHRRNVQRARPLLQGRRVRDLTAHDLRRVVTRLEATGLAPLTVGVTMGSISVALNFAVKNGYADRNVWRDVTSDDRPGGKRDTEPRYLAADELAKLFEEAADDYRPIYLIMFHMALRISETLGLIWADIDLKAGTLDITLQVAADRISRVPLKTEASYRVGMEMPPALVQELQAHRSRQAKKGFQLVRPDAFVFPSAQGKGSKSRFDGRSLAPTTLRGALNRDAKVAGLVPAGAQPVGPHDLRHSAAAAAFEAGASVVEVCEFMRHANPGVTLDTYAGLTKEGKNGARRKMLAVGIGA